MALIFLSHHLHHALQRVNIVVRITHYDCYSNVFRFWDCVVKTLSVTIIWTYVHLLCTYVSKILPCMRLCVCCTDFSYFCLRLCAMYRGLRRLYCLFDLNEMFDLLHTFTTKKSMKMKNRPPSAHKEFNSVWADGGRFFIFINFLVVKWCRRSKNENYAKKKRSGIVSPQFF